MSNVVKTINIVIMCIVMFASLVACKSIKSAYYHEKIENNCRLVMDLLVQRNSKELYDQFSDRAKANNILVNVETIDKMCSFIEGNIISYNQYEEGGGSRSKKNGEDIYYSCYPEYKLVVTDRDKSYTVRMNLTYIDTNNDENVGINAIWIMDNDTGAKMEISIY